MAKQKKTVYKKKEKKGALLPQILRKIPAIPQKYLIIIVWFFGFLAILLLISCVALIQGYFVKKEERVKALNQLVRAQNLIKEHPEEAEVYYTAALYALRLRDYETAKTYLNQALFLNPDMQEVQVLLQQIEGRL